MYLRLAKYISRRGVCSRREAERLIKQGVVGINGLIVTDCACPVLESDLVTVRGNALPSEEPAVKLWLYNKPEGLITTHNDDFNRSTVFDNVKIPDYNGYFISIGRLDMYTGGLLLLTNSGKLARFMELPLSKISRVYIVEFSGSDSAINNCSNIVTDEMGNKYTIEHIELLIPGKAKISLCEGKNREVRNIMATLGLKVLKLTRIAYGPFILGDLSPGEVKEVPWPQPDIAMN